MNIINGYYRILKCQLRYRVVLRQSCLVYSRFIKQRQFVRDLTSRSTTSYRAVSHTSGTPTHKNDSVIGHFDDAQLSLQSKSLSDIFVALAILKLCRYNVIMGHCDQLLYWSKKLLGRQLYEHVMKRTFYKQFMAGESERDVTNVALSLKRFNIHCMFYVPTEEVATGDAVNELEIREDGYEANLKWLLDVVDLTAQHSTFTQSRITAVMNSSITQNVAALMQNHLYDHTSRPAELQVETWEDALSGIENIVIPQLSEAVNIHIGKALGRLNTLAKHAERKGVRLMLDAEHTYIQPCIDATILAMQKKYNQTTPVVYNTYQCYRKDTPARLRSDIAFAKKHNFKIACKLVRGAYMVMERERANKFGYEDPLCATYEETGENYKTAMDIMLSEVCEGTGALMIATHNEECVLYGMERMKELGINPQSGDVCFGQIYGMCDHVTFTLGNMEYLVHKSVPYGSLDHALLYLIRRAQENKSVMARTAKEAKLLVQELKRRNMKTWNINKT